MKKSVFLVIILFLIIASSCKNKKSTEEEPSNTLTSTAPPDISNTFGFGVLTKIKGIWNGPVTSTTPLGGYPVWIVDFRPISENQISAKNELDTLNDIHLSFFIAKYNNQYKVAFRNGGSFNGMKRVSYFLADSVSENASQSYYRFSEIIKGKQRAFTTVLFKNDSLIIKSYTNKYNTLPAATAHMSWNAKLQDTSSCQAAVSNFGYPKKTLTKDFSSTFTGQQEAVYFSLSSDPYPESAQPYLGKANISYSFDGAHIPTPTKKVFLFITTQPLISGFSILTNNLKTRSRYIVLAANDLSYTFDYMHPGIYFVYALYDNDNNGVYSSGDWVSTTNTTFTLSAQGTSNASTQINFTYP